MHIYIYKHT